MFSPSKPMYQEGATGSSGSASTVVGTGPGPINTGLNLSNVAYMSNVACANLWNTINADPNGYTMVNALQEPDGTCIIDFMDTDGDYYTQTYSSQSIQKGSGTSSTTSPSKGPNNFNEQVLQRTDF
jgi:hypothetical protein